VCDGADGGDDGGCGGGGLGAVLRQALLLNSKLVLGRYAHCSLEAWKPRQTTWWPPLGRLYTHSLLCTCAQAAPSAVLRPPVPALLFHGTNAARTP
jgi:hypothetical protein